MDIGKFNEVTSQVFKDYGFLKYGNQFYLNLDRVVIGVDRMGARFEKGAKAFLYTCCFKDIHPDYKFEKREDFKNMPHDFLARQYLVSSEILYSGNNEPYNKWAFYPEEYTQEKWKVVLNEMLHKAFDSFSVDPFEVIRKANKVRNRNLFFVLKKDVAEFIGVENY